MVSKSRGDLVTCLYFVTRARLGDRLRQSRDPGNQEWTQASSRRKVDKAAELGFTMQCTA